MSTADATDGGGRSMVAAQRGHKRWLRERDRLKKRELKQQLAAAQRAAADLNRRYERSFEKIARAERRGLAAVTAAFDESDEVMNRLLQAHAAIRDLEAKLGAVK